MRDKSHIEQVERWARRCKRDMKGCQEELTPFINSQIEMANDFYARLAKTKNGKEKVMQLRRIPER